ncbi:MAG TPA: ABC transporter permease, partial [Thermoplasmata archaeon]
MNPNRIFADLVVFARGYFRNPIGLFFSLFFPIILVSIFGVIFSAGGSPVTLYVVNSDAPSSTSAQFLADLNHTGAVSVQVVDTSDLSTYLADHSYPVGLVIPKGFAAALANHTPIALSVYGNPQDPTSLGIAESAVA